MNKIGKNFAYNMLYHIVSLVIPLIVNPYITRIINQELLGINAYVCAQVSYFCLFGTLGINYLGTREISKLNNKGIDFVKKRFFSLYHLQAINYCVILFLYIVYLLLIPSYKELKIMYLLMVLSSMTDINWFFMGIEKFQFISIRNVLIRIICTCLVFVFIKNDNDINLYVLCLYLPQLLLNVFMWLSVFRIVGKNKNGFSISKNDLKKNLELAIPSIAISVYTILDRLVIGWYQKIEMVSIYEQGQSIIRIVLSIVSAFGVVVMPRISNMIHEDNEEEKKIEIKKCAEFTWFLSSLLMFGMLGVVDIFINWYLPHNYHYVTNVIIYSSPLILISSAENIMGVQILIPHGGEKGYSLSLVVAALINFLLNLIFIPRYGVAAACICSVIAELSALIIQCYYVRRIINLRWLFDSSCFYWIVGIVMFFLLTILKTRIVQTDIVKTILLVIIGGSFYLTICLSRIRIKKIKKG